MKVKIFDVETYVDSTVVVFKENKEPIYDVFVQADNIPGLENLPFVETSILEKLKFRKNVNIYHLCDLKNYIKTHKKSHYLAGYNNQSFDNPIIAGIILGKLNTSAEIYTKAQEIIGRNSLTGFDKFKRDYWDNELGFKYIDIFKINHYDNANRRCSLKHLEFSYRLKSIDDLPIDHTTPISKLSVLLDVIKYCCKDCDATEICVQKTKNKIISRLLINKDYKSKGIRFFDCMNWSDVKIGEYRSLYQYGLKVNMDVREVKKIPKPKYPANFKIKYADNIPDYIQFKSPKLQEWLKNLKKKEILATEDVFEIVSFNNVDYTFGKGGIHSKDTPRLIKPNSNEILSEIDVGGQYPSFLIKSGKYPRHLGKEWNETLESDYFERLNKWKPMSKDKSLNETDRSFADIKQNEIKLALNGGRYGKLGEVFSIQYDPEVRLAVCLVCQLEILMLNEMLTNIGVTVYSSNTDGSLVKYPKSLTTKFWKVCNEWEKIIGADIKKVGLLEETKYSLFAQTSVNNYIAISENGKYIKRKGEFNTYEDIKNDAYHKNASALIIPKAIEQYFLNGTPIEKTINAENNIHEFLIGAKKNKAFRFLFTTDKFIKSSNALIHDLTFNDNRFIRYFMGGDTTVSKMFLRNGNKRLLESFTRLESSGKVTIANKLKKENIIEADNITNNFEKLDRSWYINKALRIINSIVEVK